MNWTRSGKFTSLVSWLPRHSTGISVQAAPSVFPANVPEAMRQSTPVSQASPSGSSKFDFSGYRGARERAPQRRGLKMGSMLVGVGFTGGLGLALVAGGSEKRRLGAAALQSQTAASARERKRSRLRRHPCLHLSAGDNARTEGAQPPK